MRTIDTEVDLDETQRRVVDHDGGPLLVLGSPGTGKTTVLVERWVRLATGGVDAHRALLLLPTRERAVALRNELPYRLPGDAVLEVPAHTWHALAYHLVTRYHRRLGYPQPPVRLTNAEQWNVVRELLRSEDRTPWDAYGAHLTSDAFVSEVADFCVRAGYRGMSDDDLRALAGRRPEHAPVAAFALRYRSHLQSNGYLDYPELIAAAARLLTNDDDIRGAVRRRFTHVLVDDAQELTPVQLTLLAALDLSHLVCAGDPDSAIEAFRGADPTWLQRFAEIAPSHETLVLPSVHRFGKAIGHVARSLIDHAPNGAHRVLDYSTTDGEAELRHYATMAGELEAAARELRTAHLLWDVPYERMAVLLAQPSSYGHALERVLTDFGVPYRMASADRPLGAEPAVRAVLDVCRLALTDPQDDLCKAVLSSPIVGMHPYRVRDLERTAFLQSTTLSEIAQADNSDEARELATLLQAASADETETADETFARVFAASKWCGHLAEGRRTDPESAHHVDAMVALATALTHFVERQSGGTMRDYLERSLDASFATDTWAPDSPNGRPEGVQVLSFHRSKGLEWDVVCVLGVAEGQIPKAHRAQGLFDPWALDAGGAQDRALAQLAEERRTLYVALTRARRRLVVSCSPGVRRSVPSRFCEEAFGQVPDPLAIDPDQPPVTLAEAASQHRRTLAKAAASDADKAAAAAALARIAPQDSSAWWWRRQWTAGDPLYPEGKLTTSYSRISRYDECPLRYVLESVLGLDPSSTFQMKFGSLVHRIIERSDPAYGDIKTQDEAVAAYRAEFAEHHKDDYPNLIFARVYFTYGVQSIKRWWRAERSVGETIAVEYAFDDLDFNGHTIRGRIDRVAKSGGGLVLSDYKTSRSAISWDEAKDSLQLAIYYLAAKRYPDLTSHGEPNCMQLVYPGIEHQDRATGSLECAKRQQRPEHAEQVLARLDTILEGAAAERFAPSPEANCQWCRMRPLCPRWPEGKEVPR